MKKICFRLLVFTAILFSACNNSSNKKEQAGHDMNTMNKDPNETAAAPGDKEVKVVAVTYTNVDEKAAASIKKIVGHYLHIKNALANDNGNETATGAKAMTEAITTLDKSLLTAEQKSAYDKIEEELKEHASHIAKNGDKINHQRSQFSMLSNNVYNLVKLFGAGQPLYHDHCPMYDENKGAMWLSEMKEIKNPYFGAEMKGCGSVEEVFE